MRANIPAPTTQRSLVFFSFDGIDGVGKTTQINLFCQWLRKRGQTVTQCRDPGSTPLGEQIRQLLLDHNPTLSIHRRSEMLLYMAARAQLVEQVIRPALNRGEVVVSDRFLLANVVYQGHAGMLPVEQVRAVGRVTIDDIEPDAVFLLDLPVELADERLSTERDRMESQGNDFRHRLREGFLAEAEADNRIHVLDATHSIDQIHRAVRQIAEPLLEAAAQ